MVKAVEDRGAITVFKELLLLLAREVSKPRFARHHIQALKE
jgi:hypothetical protein